MEGCVAESPYSFNVDDDDFFVIDSAANVWFVST